MHWTSGEVDLAQNSINWLFKTLILHPVTPNPPVAAGPGTDPRTVGRRCHHWLLVMSLRGHLMLYHLLSCRRNEKGEMIKTPGYTFGRLGARGVLCPVLSRTTTTGEIPGTPTRAHAENRHGSGAGNLKQEL